MSSLQFGMTPYWEGGDLQQVEAHWNHRNTSSHSRSAQGLNWSLFSSVPRFYVRFGHAVSFRLRRRFTWQSKKQRHWVALSSRPLFIRNAELPSWTALPIGLTLHLLGRKRELRQCRRRINLVTIQQPGPCLKLAIFCTLSLGLKFSATPQLRPRCSLP